jgi:DAACS family dicarboxylate/amino acid:cation (Na+ or H+) symporter
MATTGWELLRSLLGYFLVVVGGMALHLFGVYALVVWLLGGRSPFGFFRDAREAMFTAFGTSSSNATLPVAMRVAEESLRLPPKISRFVLTVGASANQNGTALYEGVTVLFLAQVFGVELTLAQQFTVALMCILAGVGTAGVPGGSLPLVVGVLMTINVPAQSIAIILGIDRFLDMCRTTLNVTGDLVIATVVARGSKDDAG